ncbi:hypothetical protein LOTGIDRAFT_167234 [Lottia gigantea]|uniref:Fucolectin tachylectin-4 pentraxin-1 domain-containing protein n=1 Tax=Lottia gigantea TaxID=225164 RepID=V3ZV34_LOTGI|nr:hypothetical protein LOTGIDRAFT_167234 [Lottia gigantea]ESO86420.1 hypothetical protein LOTGIDRAFT_167234 [Lottia gigantea]
MTVWTRLSYYLLLFESCITFKVKGYNFGFNNSYTCDCLNNKTCDTVIISRFNNSYTCDCLNNKTCDTVIILRFNNSYTCHCLNNKTCDTVMILRFNNIYTCHCLNNKTCDTVTSVGYKNIAYKKPANQSGQETETGPQEAVDGSKSIRSYFDCIDTGYSPWAWWLVDLGRLFSLRYLKIYYRSGTSNPLCKQEFCGPCSFEMANLKLQMA